jgi:hypothetical protein
MPYEIFTRKIRKLPTPAVTLNSYGRMQFNKAATARLEREAVENVLLLWDKDTKKVALRSINKKDQRAYPVAYGAKGNGAGFSTKTFFDYIGLDFSQSRTIPIEFGEGDILMEFQIPEDAFLKDQQPKLVHDSSKMNKTA